MEPRCDYCGVSRALVYCKSDLAKLCLNCDSCVHSANPLSRRHPRSLICDKCFSQSAVIRCLDEKLSLCQACHWTGNCSGLGHSLRSLNPYSGCPSPIEFTKIWPTILEPSGSANDSSCSWMISSLVGSFPLNQNYLSSYLDQRYHSNGLLGMVKTNDLDGWIGSSSSVVPQSICCTQNLRDQSSLFSEEPIVPKGCSDVNLNLQEADDICEGLNLDDAPLNFDAGEDICSQSPTKYNQYEDTVPDCLLVDKNSSVTGSNCPIENALEASSSGQQDCVSYQSQQVCGPNNLMQPMNGNGNVIMSSTCGRNINIGLPPPPAAASAGQIHRNMSLSLSNITGESSATDYQDCGLSPGLLMGDSPWESNLEVSCPEARDRAKLRYKQKKSRRTFGKQIRYASRKARADTRKRVKGRFVKAGDAYDYDPLEEELLKSSNQDTEIRS